MAERKVGDVLDGLGVTLEIDDEDMVTDAVVLAKTVDAGGRVALVVGTSESMSWLEQLGLVYAAADLVRQAGHERDDD